MTVPLKSTEILFFQKLKFIFLATVQLIEWGLKFHTICSNKILLDWLKHWMNWQVIRHQRQAFIRHWFNNQNSLIKLTKNDRNQSTYIPNLQHKSEFRLSIKSLINYWKQTYDFTAQFRKQLHNIAYLLCLREHEFSVNRFSVLLVQYYALIHTRKMQFSEIKQCEMLLLLVGFYEISVLITK